MRFGKRTLAGVAAGALALGALTIASAPAASAKPSIKPKATAAGVASPVRPGTYGTIPNAQVAFNAATLTTLTSDDTLFGFLTTAPTGGVMYVDDSAGVQLATDDSMALGRTLTTNRVGGANSRFFGTTSTDDSFFTIAATTAGHGDVSAYAANWAVVAMLARHPRYAPAFARLERGPLDAAFTERLAELDGWDEARASRDFDAFIAEVEYGFDFARSAIDWAAGRPLAGKSAVQVDATRGWQNTGLTLAARRRYAIVAEGRVVLGTVARREEAETTTLESEPRGISLRWYRGRPIGRLLAAQWNDRPQTGRPRFEIVAEGGDAAFTAAVDGPLYLKVNESPGELGDNRGAVTVSIEPE
jgi:hypothetical protein